MLTSCLHLQLTPEELRQLVVKQLRLVAEDDEWAEDPQFLQEIMVSTYERRRFQTEVINEMPLYPTETVLWDENQVPDVHYTGVLPGQVCCGASCCTKCGWAVTETAAPSAALHCLCFCFNFHPDPEALLPRLTRLVGGCYLDGNCRRSHWCS